MCPSCLAATGFSSIGDCADGVCVPPAVLLGQFPGLAICNGACVDLQSDAFNCGGCGVSCGGLGCINGQCQECPEGTFVCPGFAGCLDFNTNALHCGGCDRDCNDQLSGGICSGGSCTCPPSKVACNGTCVTVDTVANCGSCGNACDEGQTCANGQCVCSAGLAFCDPDCVDLQTDTANCGACGNVCPTCQAVTGSSDPGVCVNGDCAPPASAFNQYPGLDICGGACVDTQTDEQHCGGCGKVCPANSSCFFGECYCDATGDKVAIGGSCASTCKSAGTDCALNSDCCSAQCVDNPRLDRYTCACPGGTVFSPNAPCGKISQGNYVGDVICCGDSPETAVCASAQNDIPVCCKNNPSGEVLTEYIIGCNGACVDTFSDANNCGGCGIVCPSGQCTVGGYCYCDAENQACPAGTNCNTTLKSCR